MPVSGVVSLRYTVRIVLLSVSVSVGEPLDNYMQARKRARSALEGRLAPPQLVPITNVIYMVFEI